MVARHSLRRINFIIGVMSIVVSVGFIVAMPKIADALPAAYEGYWWSPNHGNSVANGSTYNFISDNVYMQHAVSYDGYTDITETTLKIYSTSSRVQVEVFGADLCTNQPSYTTDEFYTSSRSSMRATYSVAPADDEVGRIGVIRNSATRASASTTGTYRGSACTADSARKVMVARSNVYDQTLGRYVYNFTAKASLAQRGFINGFRIRALSYPSSGTTASGIIISADPGQSADHYGLEVGYPRADNGNSGGSSTYADYAVPFVPDCGMSGPTSKYISIFDDDQNDSSIQSNRLFRVKVQATNGSDRDIRFTNITGELSASGPASDGYYTVVGGNQRTVRLYFTMDPNQSYVFRVDNLYQNNTLQISIPATTSPTRRNCPSPSVLNGVKVDDSRGVAPYGGNYGGTYPFNNLNVQVDGSNSTANPFVFSGANSINVTNASGERKRVSITDLRPATNNGWVLRGYAICRSGGSCTSAWLTDPNNIRRATVSSNQAYFDYTFLPNTTYSMRWIFSRAIDVDCNYDSWLSPANVDRWTNFSVRAGVSYTNASYSPSNARVSMRLTRGATTVYTGPTQTPTRSADRLSAYYDYGNINIAPPLPAGQYTATWTYSDGQPNNFTCSRDFRIGYLPFVRVSGGDLFAGDGTTSTSVQSWNYDVGPDFYGGGSDLATLGTGSIKNFATGRSMPSGQINPIGLSFSNETTNVANGQYGGDLVALPTPPDRFASLASGAIPRPGGAVNVGTLPSGTYLYDSDVTISGVVPAGRNVTILVDGRAVISGNIDYAPYTLATVPRLNVFTNADSDILVASTVTMMHGFYGTSGSGKFYTCANMSTSPATAIDYTDLDGPGIYALCNNRLTIYGSVQSSEIILGRTAGSLYQPGGNPAELFVYSPELWLASPSGGSTGGPTRAESYISRPPVL